MKGDPRRLSREIKDGAGGLHPCSSCADALVLTAARDLVLSNFPATVAPDVLEAAGLDPREVLGAGALLPEAEGVPGARRRGWRFAVLEAWDRQCALSGYDGQFAGASMGIEAAHVRWFAFDGPDSLDNGLALCALHHKLFHLGAFGLDTGLRVMVSLNSPPAPRPAVLFATCTGANCPPPRHALPQWR